MLTLPTGVYKAYKKYGSEYYRASVTYLGKHISLGSFPSDFCASKAYEAARTILDSDISLKDYTTDSYLSFDKWVSLINFRDNKMYFKTPIYLFKKFFLYYIDKDTHYTFDADDLFYYSNHKIMRRGGYLFVYDYGMQINILSRYGIRNYAVCGRDYRFVNGDTTDYRYKNIEIINKYYGVYEYVKNGRTLYKAKIHINGNYVIGTYKSETEAATAYNKAVDYLRSKGIKKDYAENYIEGLSAIEYASLYTQIRISKKLKNAFP